MTGEISSNPVLPPLTVESIDKGFRLSCPGLGITCTAPTLEIGYSTLLEIAKNSTFETRPHSPQPVSPVKSVRNDRSRHISRFVIAAVLLPVAFVTLQILNDVRSVVRNISTLSSSADGLADNTPLMARTASVRLAQIADTIEKITPERQAELRFNLERISLKLAPAAEGLRPLLEAAGLVPVKAGPAIPLSPVEPPSPADKR